MKGEVKREGERSPSMSKWRYTWEGQSEIERIRLILFNPIINPNQQCRNLHFDVETSFIHVLFTFHGDTAVEEEGSSISISAPIPKRVLLDVEEDSALSWSYKLMDDHIQLNLLLLLPLHHALLSHEDIQHLRYDSDLKLLLTSSRDGDGDDSRVRFYCRKCSASLTNKPIRDFVEMPSADWQEAADNWFGGCCCSFDGISDKLVARFADSYSLAQGTCLLNTMFIVLSKDDFVGCKFPEWVGHQHHEDQAHTVCNNDKIGTICNFGSQDHSHKAHDVYESCEFKGGKNTESLVNSCRDLDLSAQVVLKTDCCAHSETETSLTAQAPMKSVVELLEYQKWFLNGFLGNLFMVKSSHLSKDIDWIDFECPRCASVLGAYPCKEGYKPIDGGVRLLKCHVSTSLPGSDSDDIFRKYTLEKMFTYQLLENAKDEMSFRTLVRDMESKSPALQIILLNPNSWCSSGYCTDTAVFMEGIPNTDTLPVMKVLFLDCIDTSTSQLRQVEEWAKKNEAEEVYMMKQEIKHLIECLDSAKQSFPPSCAFLQGLPLSYLHR